MATASKVLACCALTIAWAGGCDNDHKLYQPSAIQTPFPTEQLWAVVPFMNESGVSNADGARVADEFVKAVEEADGLACVPLNRTLAAMQALGMRSVTTDADAIRLREALGVDGLVVGTVTLWDPYPPPKEGLAVQVYLRSGASPWREVQPGRPAAQASGIFDASNHAVLMSLHTYAQGRHPPGSAFGEDIYLVDMERFSEFASHELLRDLLGKLGQPGAPKSS